MTKSCDVVSLSQTEPREKSRAERNRGRRSSSSNNEEKGPLSFVVVAVMDLVLRFVVAYQIASVRVYRSNPAKGRNQDASNRDRINATREYLTAASMYTAQKSDLVLTVPSRANHDHVLFQLADESTVHEPHIQLSRATSANHLHVQGKKRKKQRTWHPISINTQTIVQSNRHGTPYAHAETSNEGMVPFTYELAVAL